MRILKKSVIKPITCDVCLCVLQLKHRDLVLKSSYTISSQSHFYTTCKMCGNVIDLLDIDLFLR